MAEGKVCVNCGNTVSELLRIDADMKQRLSSEAGMDTTADAVCANCFSAFGAQIAKGAMQRSRRMAKEQHRLSLWRSRVQLVKEARDRFGAKDYSGAAIAYEKYIRVLEIIYETKANELLPAHFNNSARQKELVVIASAYWDLLRIYDQSKKLSHRMNQCADKLAEFLPFCPIYQELAQKIEEHARTTAKNKDKFYQVLSKAKKGRRRCFIATAAFESPDAQEVILLAQFRDQILVRSSLGRRFISAYYLTSPKVAEFLDKSPRLKPLVRAFLRALASSLRARFNLKS